VKVWVFVEGESDRLALEALWKAWKERLREQRHGIAIIPLGSKGAVLKRIGARAAEKIINNNVDLAVGLPDLYPNANFAGTPFNHDNLADLRQIQTSSVRKALRDIYGKRDDDMPSLIERFRASALKHDLEVLLLAAREELRAYLGTSDRLGGWRHPVEEQNQQRAPKHIVKDLFMRYKNCRYRETVDAPSVLRRVADIADLLYDDNHRLQCPVFKELLDWVGAKTGVPAYSPQQSPL